jgi:hypothetical protein
VEKWGSVGAGQGGLDGGRFAGSGETTPVAEDSSPFERRCGWKWGSEWQLQWKVWSGVWQQWEEHSDGDPTLYSSCCDWDPEARGSDSRVSFAQQPGGALSHRQVFQSRVFLLLSVFRSLSLLGYLDERTLFSTILLHDFLSHLLGVSYRDTAVDGRLTDLGAGRQ